VVEDKLLRDATREYSIWIKSILYEKHKNNPTDKLAASGESWIPTPVCHFVLSSEVSIADL
jgi:hypothetical protein